MIVRRHRDTLTVEIPIRTVSEANTRTHWATRARRVKGHRRAAGLVLRASGVPGWVLAALRPKGAYGGNLERLKAVANCTTVAVTLTRIAPKALDSDNLQSALKATRDGVADALGVDDRDSRVEWHCAQRKGAPRTYAVEVRIEPSSKKEEGLSTMRKDEAIFRHDNCQGGRHDDAHSDAEGIRDPSPTDLPAAAGRSAASAGREGSRARRDRSVDARAGARVTSELSPMLAGEE